MYKRGDNTKSNNTFSAEKSLFDNSYKLFYFIPQLLRTKCLLQIFCYNVIIKTIMCINSKKKKEVMKNDEQIR